MFADIAKDGGVKKNDQGEGPPQMPFSSTPEIIEELKAGRIVVLTDAEDRENEGDLVALADRITPDQVNFMLREARGLLCLALSADICDRLRLTVQTKGSGPRFFSTAFTETIDAAQGITTGVSSADRWTTIRACTNPEVSAKDLVKPGHLQPIRARRGGVLVRPGHTEATVDLARLCGAPEAAVIMEIMNEDGTMSRLPDLIPYAKKHGLKIGSIANLIEYRRKNEKLVERVASSPFPTPWGDFTLHLYSSPFDQRQHLALVKGIDLPEDGSPGESIDQPVLGRVHAECLTSDVFGSPIGGRSGEVEAALRRLSQEDRGFFLYMRQGERGASLAATISEFGSSPDNPASTRQTMDERNYGTGAQILADLGIREIRLLSNGGPRKRNLSGYNLNVVAVEPFGD